MSLTQFKTTEQISRSRSTCNTTRSAFKDLINKYQNIQSGPTNPSLLNYQTSSEKHLINKCQSQTARKPSQQKVYLSRSTLTQSGDGSCTNAASVCGRSAKRSETKSSLHSRLSVASDDVLPSPASYTLPPCIGLHVPNKPRSGVATINARIWPHPEGYGRSPGPANYSIPDTNKYKPKTPQYSLSGRKIDPFKTGKMQTPAPWTYFQEYSALQKKGFTFGSKHSVKKTNLILPEDSVRSTSLL